MDQIVYLDANILVPVLWDFDPELRSACEDTIRNLKGDVRSQPGRRVKIPKLAIGEIVNIYIDDMMSRPGTANINEYHSMFMGELMEIVDQLDAELSSIQTECWNVVRELKNEDRELGFNDLYLAGMAICDNYSTHLIAKDSDLVETRALDRVAKRRPDREYGFSVVQSW